MPSTRTLTVAALALVLATPALADYAVRDANGSIRMLRGNAGSSGSITPLNSIADPAGQPYGPNYGQPVAPAIAPAMSINRSVTVVTAGTPVQAMAANSARKGGYCQASYSALGTVSLATTGGAAAAPNVSNDVELQPGQAYDLNQHGNVEQGAVSITSTHSGDVVLCKEIQ